MDSIETDMGEVITDDDFEQDDFEEELEKDNNSVKLPVSTMVMVADFENPINKDVFMEMAPVLAPTITQRLRPYKHVVPTQGQLGDLMYVANLRAVRGQRAQRHIQQYKTAFMRNLSDGKIYCSDQVCTFKCYNQGLLVSGFKEPEVATEAFRLISNHLLQIQADLDYLHSLPREKVDMVVELISKNVKGPCVPFKLTELVVVNIAAEELSRESNMRTGRKDAYADFHIRPAPTGVVSVGISYDANKETLQTEVPIKNVSWLTQQTGSVTVPKQHKKRNNYRIMYAKAMDQQAVSQNLLLPFTNNMYVQLPHPRVVQILTNAMPCMHTYEQWRNHVDKILSTRQAFVPPLLINTPKSTLQNCQLSLGDNIDRQKLCNALVSQGVAARFPDQNHYVRVVYRYDMNPTIRKSVSQLPMVTISVFRTGNANVSGPDQKTNKEVVQKFLSVYRSIRDQVIETDPEPPVKKLKLDV